MHLILWFSLLLKVTFAGKLGRNCQCTVTGDPHYRTFDGQRITLTGHCKYLMVTTKLESKLDPLKVEVKNEKRGKVKVPYTNRIDITLGKYVVQFRQHSQVTVNGIQVLLPFVTPEFNVTLNGVGAMKLSTEDRVVITFDGHKNGNVTLPLCYAGNVRGLCGDCNGLEDDYRLGNGSDVTRQQNNFDPIGESYKVPDKNDTDPSCRQAGAFHRLKRQTVPLSAYDDLRNMCKNRSSNIQLQLKSAQNNLTVQIDTLRKVCDLIEHFERTSQKGRELKYTNPKEDYYAVGDTHFIRVTNAVFYKSVILSVYTTPSLTRCLTGCAHIKICIGVTYIMKIMCVTYEKQMGVAAVVPGPFQDVFLKITDVFRDEFLVRGGSKLFHTDMLLHVSLDECKEICRQCITCGGIQYNELKRLCMVFNGIGENGPLIAVKGGWVYHGFLNRICSKTCAKNARCLVSSPSNHCKCKRDYIGDGEKECKKV